MADKHETKSNPKPLGRLFKWLKIFFLIYVASEIMMLAGNTLSLSLGSTMFGPNEPFSIGDVITSFGALALLIGFVCSIIWFCIFSYRATRNLHIWNMPDMHTSPGWAVGWYFVPIANLWKPHGTMDQMWTATQALTKEFDDIAPTLGLWWICWVATNILGNISWRMGIRAGMFEPYASDVSMYKTTLMIDIISSITGIIAALVILRVLAKIALKQDAFLRSGYFD